MRILLVEDCLQDIELLRAVVEAQVRCRFTVAGTSREFDAALKRELPDIIVSDSNLPTFDGLRALAIAIHTCPEVPFVFCSGSTSQTKKAKALARGATSWVSKDDGFAHLVSEIKRLCAHYKL